MEILSYPIGLLVGLFPIAASLGPSKAPAHLLLDGRPVCELTERSPGCMVDLGRDPRVHLLELLRTDAAGHVTERVRRWVNRPGIESEVLASRRTATRRRDGASSTSPGPILDGSIRSASTSRSTERPSGTARQGTSCERSARTRGATRRSLVADAEFPDGTRATLLAHALRDLSRGSAGRAPGRAAPPSPDAGSDESVATALRSAGWPVRTVEDRRDRHHIRHAADGVRRRRRLPEKIPDLPARTRKISERSRAPTSAST